MKKINYFIIVAAILMLIVPLLGCPTAYKDADVAIVLGNIIGDAWVIGTPLEFDGAEAIVDLKYSNSMDAWGNGNGTLAFAIRQDKGWAVKYTGATDIAVGAGYATTTLNHNDNNTFVGLVDGKDYVITVSRAGGVKVRIDEKK